MKWRKRRRFCRKEMRFPHLKFITVRCCICIRSYSDMTTSNFSCCTFSLPVNRVAANDDRESSVPSSAVMSYLPRQIIRLV